MGVQEGRAAAILAVILGPRGRCVGLCGLFALGSTLLGGCCSLGSLGGGCLWGGLLGGIGRRLLGSLERHLNWKLGLEYDQIGSHFFS